MSDYSFGDSQNPKAKRLHDKVSMLAASALDSTTKVNYDRAWAQFLYFCDKIGYNPMEASGQDLATWVVFRSEQTFSPNMLESDLKAVKCFRQSANKPISDPHIADSVLKGLLKTKEAKLLFRLGLEPEMVQILIHNAIYEIGPDSFVGIRQAANYAMMYWGTARFKEVKELQLRQICKKGASLEIKILKGKKYQTRRLQRCVIHPNSLHFQG